MDMILLFLTILIAILSLWLSAKFTIPWIKKSFVVYGLLFTLTAFAIAGILISEHWPTIQKTAGGLLQTKIYTPPQKEISKTAIREAVYIEAPSISQLPELPRGCEVTTLAMLMQYFGENVDKMELAEKVKRDTTPYQRINGEIHFGNPYDGFVGDMYSFANPGLGVYHGPIADLAREYFGDQVIDFSGGSFNEIIHHLNNGQPVWVIINSTYKELPDHMFTTWHTPSGPIEITRKEHSVLITGYDQDYIYFNDPLHLATKAPYEDFKAAWEQMGKQAITISK